MVSVVLTDMKPRLEAAAAAVTSTRDAHRAEVELRNQLVVAAIDQGMSQRVTAAAAGISVARVCAILAGSQNDD
jgi:hypothetical protein